MCKRGEGQGKEDSVYFHHRSDDTNEKDLINHFRGCFCMIISGNVNKFLCCDTISNLDKLQNKKLKINNTNIYLFKHFPS